MEQQAASPAILRDQPERGRLVLTVEGGEAFASYRRAGDRLIVFHTEVPGSLRGRGLGSRLAEAVFAHARSEGLRITPACSFIADWARRHPDYRDVLADG